MKFHLLWLLPVALVGWAQEPEQTPPPAANKRLPLEELRLFTQIYDHVRNAYVEEVSDETLLESAIVGLLNGLDPHSAYLDADSFADLQEETQGEYSGIGVEVGAEDGLVKVISPIDGTPADKAGIKAGDLITTIDGKPVRGIGPQKAIEMMRGKPGSILKLIIYRPGEKGPLELEVTRDLIEVTSVRTRWLSPGYGYVRVAQFRESTGDQFVSEIKKLNDVGQLKGLIIDLRNNPGGVLQASVQIVDALQDGGIVVSTKGRAAGVSAEYTARPGDLLNGAPIVVLINEGSASASEIVAGALQDNHRAVVIGTQSFGKGSVQTVVPIDETRAIKLTTARYYTPSGRSIQAEGIVPDIEVKPAKVEEYDLRGFIKEENLSGHLENDAKADTAKQQQDAALAKDNQLMEALRILQGIVLARR